jgi:hypothetical protein
MIPEVTTTVQITFKTLRIKPFMPLLQTGFHLPIPPAHRSVQTFLCEACGLDPSVVQERIQTLFLNGNPVDDREAATLRHGDTLALSAAMPGLVGATMRSGGVLACFRNTLSHRVRDTAAMDQAGLLKIKLFNLLIREMGPWFLSRGIWVSGPDMQQTLAGLSDADWRNCREAVLDQHPMDPDLLRQMQWAQDTAEVSLRVFFEDSMGGE